jgi:hypothetical protein
MKACVETSRKKVNWHRRRSRAVNTELDERRATCGGVEAFPEGRSERSEQERVNARAEN